MERHFALPLQATAHDTLRQGLPCFKSESCFSHPVQVLQAEYEVADRATGKTFLANLYGSAVPAKLEIERQILSRPGHLPGLAVSRLGLDSLTGALDEFGFEYYLGDVGLCETPPVDLHCEMEARLGLSKAVKRGLQ